MAPHHRRGVLSITVVSRTAETLVEAYLRRAGVSTHGTRSLERSADMLPPSASAVVFFADDFPREAVITALGTVHARRPDMPAVIVTGEPASFLSLPSGRGAVLVLPKPAWGWTILDALRAHLEPAGPRGALVERIGRLLSRRP